MQLVDSENRHKQVNLVQYRRLEGRWQFVRVVRKNGKPDPRLILVHGEPASSKGGHFYLAWREDGKLKRQAVGPSPREALNARHLKVGTLAGDVEPEPETETAETKTIDAAIGEYLRDVKATKSAATYKAYKCDLAWFRKHCRKHLVSRLDRSNAMALFGAGREEGLNQKTTNKRVVVMLQAMRGAGAEIKLRKGDWPKTADKQIEVYTPDELKKFFQACNEDERILFQTFLLTGFRSEEIATLTWPDIHHTTGKISVSAKPQWKFTPKSYEIRSVEVPSALLAKLKRRQKQGNSLLVFPAPKHPTRPNYGGDGVDAHLLEMCKQIALRAGLNCGRVMSKGRIWSEYQGVASSLSEPVLVMVMLSSWSMVWEIDGPRSRTIEDWNTAVPFATPENCGRISSESATKVASAFWKRLSRAWRSKLTHTRLPAMPRLLRE